MLFSASEFSKINEKGFLQIENFQNKKLATSFVLAPQIYVCIDVI